MKAFISAIVLGIGFLTLSAGPVRAQLGDMGEAVKKGAGGAVEQGIKGAAEKAGLPTQGAPAVTPAADAGAAGAPVDQPKVAPVAPEAPAAAPGSEKGADAPADE